MAKPGTVLMLARDFDAQADRLVTELESRAVPVFRTDLSAFPSALTLSAELDGDGWNGTLKNTCRSLRLDDIRSVWYRRPSHFVFSDKMSRPERRHASAEARAAFLGILGSLDVLWVNHPAREAAAAKPLQLAVAARCGLSKPRTHVSNCAEDVRAFAASVPGPLASKNLSAAALVEGGRIQTAYTRRLDPSDLADLRGVTTTAHLFQEFVDDKSYEVRVTVAGRRILAAAIHAGSERSRIDFRADYESLSYRNVDPPADVQKKMLTFLDELGLAFGAFDFVVTADDEWVMLECNPCGQYGWLEDELDLPITAAIADLLTGNQG